MKQLIFDNADKFLEYIELNGITEAKITEKFKNIPANTNLFFGKETQGILNYISTWDICSNKLNNRYDFDYRWSIYWHDEYKGKFIITRQTKVNPSSVTKSDKNGTHILGKKLHNFCTSANDTKTAESLIKIPTKLLLKEIARRCNATNN
jgi:hypothetical protein